MSLQSDMAYIDKRIFELEKNIELSVAYCPPGTFLMGTAEVDLPLIHEPSFPFLIEYETPQRQVTLTKGFWIGTTTVTQEQWKCVTGQNPFWDRGDSNFPVDMLTFREATEFCGQLTNFCQVRQLIRKQEYFFIPSEAQWEYACRAGTTTLWHFGNDVANLANYAWYRENSNNSPQPVGLKLPNPWGFYDFYGNLEEWCLDDLYVYKRVLDNLIDPIILNDKEIILKMTRGGSYEDNAFRCRSASRISNSVNTPYNEPIGLRVVLLEVE